MPHERPFRKLCVSQIKDKMPVDAVYADPNAWRYFDYPRPGSIYTLPDIPQLVRGPTVVLLPSGKEIKVPAQMKQMVASPAEVHDAGDNQNKMTQLMKILAGKQGPVAPAGFKIGNAPAFQQAKDHPRDQVRSSRHGNHVLNF